MQMSRNIYFEFPHFFSIFYDVKSSKGNESCRFGDFVLEIRKLFMPCLYLESIANIPSAIAWGQGDGSLGSFLFKYYSLQLSEKHRSNG